MTLRADILVGDSRELLREMPDQSFQMCVTSPPYWGLRDYGVTGQIGAEPTIDAYCESLTAIFSEVRPAATMVAVKALLDPAWRVEIEAEAEV